MDDVRGEGGRVVVVEREAGGGGGLASSAWHINWDVWACEAKGGGGGSSESLTRGGGACAQGGKMAFLAGRGQRYWMTVVGSG